MHIKTINGKPNAIFNQAEWEAMGRATGWGGLLLPPHSVITQDASLTKDAGLISDWKRGRQWSQIATQVEQFVAHGAKLSQWAESEAANLNRIIATPIGGTGETLGKRLPSIPKYIQAIQALNTSFQAVHGEASQLKQQVEAGMLGAGPKTNGNGNGRKPAAAATPDLASQLKDPNFVAALKAAGWQEPAAAAAPAPVPGSIPTQKAIGVADSRPRNLRNS